MAFFILGFMLLAVYLNVFWDNKKGIKGGFDRTDKLRVYTAPSGTQYIDPLECMLAHRKELELKK